MDLGAWPIYITHMENKEITVISNCSVYVIQYTEYTVGARMVLHLQFQPHDHVRLEYWKIVPKASS